MIVTDETCSSSLTIPSGIDARCIPMEARSGCKIEFPSRSFTAVIQAASIFQFLEYSFNNFMVVDRYPSRSERVEAEEVFEFFFLHMRRSDKAFRIFLRNSIQVVDFLDITSFKIEAFYHPLEMTKICITKLFILKLRSLPFRKYCCRPTGIIREESFLRLIRLFEK